MVWILLKKSFAEYHRELAWHIIKKMMLNSSAEGSGSVLHTDPKTRQNV